MSAKRIVLKTGVYGISNFKDIVEKSESEKKIEKEQPEFYVF